MLVYITKPLVHECIMGGLRSIALWTKRPDYHHFPTRYNSLIEGANQYVDRGWGQGQRTVTCPAKPLLEQDEELAEKVWNYIVWSCCPKDVTFEEHIKWCNTPILDKSLKDTHQTNYTNLLLAQPGGKKADINSNINYKRFLLEVNIRTNEVKVLTPKVHWYTSHDEDLFSDCNKTEETLNIDEKYATELPYELSSSGHFNYNLPF